MKENGYSKIYIGKTCSMSYSDAEELMKKLETFKNKKLKLIKLSINIQGIIKNLNK